VSNCVVLLCSNSQFSSSTQAPDCLPSLHCPGTAKAGGGDFICGKCDGTSAAGQQRYSSKAGATSCSLCPVGSRVNAAHTACISYPPGMQPGPGNARRPCPAGALPAPLHHINYIFIVMMLHGGAARLLSHMNEQTAFITGCTALQDSYLSSRPTICSARQPR
jgi:hypothetical protein